MGLHSLSHIIRRCRSSVVSIVVVNVLLLLWPRYVSATALDDLSAPWNGHRVISILSPGFMRPGAQLQVIDTSPGGHSIYPVPTALQFRYGGRRRRLVRLRDLRGCVKIRSEAQALRYVRLSKNVNAGRFLDQPGYGVEVISEDSLPKSSTGAGAQLSQSGSGGVLSRQAFRVGNFHAPIVKKTSHGFVIDRWIFDDEPFQLREVREYVGFGGRYRRVTLKFMRHPPKLPHTRWTIASIM